MSCLRNDGLAQIAKFTSSTSPSCLTNQLVPANDTFPNTVHESIEMVAIFTDASKTGSWVRAEKFGLTKRPSAPDYLESLTVAGISAFVLYFMNRAAFLPFFLGEDFNAWTLYVAADHNFLKGIFTPLFTFFRPTAYAGIISTQMLLPWDPVLHHWRNFFMLVFCVWLLYLIMLRLTDRRVARLMAITFFVLARVNFSVIGLINLVEVLFTVIYSLSTFLFLLRYFQQGRLVDYCASVGLFVLCAFARDSNVMFFFPIVAMFALHALELRKKGQPANTHIWIKLLPFLLVVVAYVGVRKVLGVSHHRLGELTHTLFTWSSGI